MTERLYYGDSYLQQFQARVTAVTERGGRTGVVLDRTAFYPASGGQPADSGHLGDAQVVDVVDQDDGTIVHVVDGAVGEGPVIGRIDWPRRFEHMQQHTGQHILSAAFDRLFGVATTSFHLGSTASTIDLARETTAEEIARAETLANEVVWEDRAVEVRFVDAEAAAALPLRKAPARAGRLRIIEVRDFDVSACGGTHVCRTGAVGLIATAGRERFRGGTRLQFHCGVRALRAYRALRDAAGAAARLLSAGPEDLGPGIDRLLAENREARRRALDLEAKLLVFETDALAARAVEIGNARVVIEAVETTDLDLLKALAQGIAVRRAHAALLVTAAAPVGVVAARAADLSIDAAALVKALAARFGGRGGGRVELAQGGGLRAQPGEVLAEARMLVRAGPG